MLRHNITRGKILGNTTGKLDCAVDEERQVTEHGYIMCVYK